jgi:hypothetical protein
MEKTTIIPVLVTLLIIVSLWITIGKAGRPGVSQIVPIWNIIEIIRISGKPLWWIFLFLIPVVNIVIAIMIYNAISQAFGKGPGFTVGMIFLPFVFWPILAFSDAKYKKP